MQSANFAWHWLCNFIGNFSDYSLNIDGKTNKDAVWYYATPKEMAKGIKDRVAFWKGVEITKQNNFSKLSLHAQSINL